MSSQLFKEQVPYRLLGDFLNDHCEREGKYLEAETAARRLKELRQHEENRRREAMRSRQTAERLGIEEAHMLEFEQNSFCMYKIQH